MLQLLPAHYIKVIELLRENKIHNHGLPEIK